MQTSGHHDSTKRHDFRPIQLQTEDRSAAASGQPDNPRVVFGPGKVFAPNISAWMIKRDFGATDRIHPGDMRMLMVITTLASQRQIPRLGRASARTRQD